MVLPGGGGYQGTKNRGSSAPGSPATRKPTLASPADFLLDNNEERLSRLLETKPIESVSRFPRHPLFLGIFVSRVWRFSVKSGFLGSPW